MAKARQQYFADEVTLQKENRDFAIQPELVEKLESIEEGAQVNVIETVKVNGEALTPDENKAVDVSVPLVEDTLYSTDTDKALSANQGKVLYEYIQNLASRGRYLSNWNAVTGLPSTNPVDNPYQYRAGDYYVVSNVAAEGGTNYRPNGSSYSRNIASTTVETEIVKVGDYYTYDGQHWLLLVNTAREIAVDSSLSTSSTNPVENRVITNALNTKQNNITDLETIRSGAALGATALQPGDSLSELTGTSDNITQGTTNLFMTTAERSKLSNQSGVNTGDETQTTIKNKLGQASTSTDGYLTSTDWNTFNNKQGAISDLETIRSNASAGKNASDTIATYGDIVTHDASEFATASQGGKADTALQPGDNVSELTNDAGYVTDAYHDDTKQDKLIAGANIQIAADGKTISATDTTYVAGDFDIKDLADSIGLRTEWSGKQDELIAGANIQIAADGKTISSTDTKYTAGVNVSISNNNVISATDSKAEWGNISGTLSDQADLNTALGGKQDTLIAGANIQIASDGKTISSTDTTYTAGPGIDITNGVISNTQTSAEWGNITGTLSDQTDLQTALDAKQDDMVILSYGNSTWNDFITAYKKNGVVYCRASSNSNPATGTQGRLAFMAYVNNADNPTEVEFQYYRSRNDHNTAANQLDEVYVYKLTSNGTWTVTQRDTAAKAVAGTGIGLSFGSGNMTISNSGVTSVNGDTGAVTLNIPTVPTNVSDFVNDAGYITANDLPAVDTAMSSTSTNAVQNNVIKNYVDTQVQEATTGAVSDTAYGSSWDGVTGIAPSKNAVYDKISAMDTTIAGKQDTISDLSTIRAGAGKGATAVQPGDNVSTLTNDAGFITKAVNDLTNYYTKSETYTKSEVADYVANFAGFKVVATLPTTDIKTTIIYLLGPVGTGADKYEEYIYSNNAWVKIGETSVDLTNYFNTSTDNSDSITQGSTNLFLTSAERTKLSNTSGTNTGDETKATIQSKLGAATSSNDGYLTSADWTTFNNKANASDINTKTFYLSSTSDLTNAQAAYDWYVAGKNPIIVYNGYAYIRSTQYGYPNSLSFYKPNRVTTESGGTSAIKGGQYIWFGTSNNTVTSIYTTVENNVGFLGTGFNNTFTPTQDGHPATKKYVDDSASGKVSKGTNVSDDLTLFTITDSSSAGEAGFGSSYIYMNNSNSGAEIMPGSISVGYGDDNTSIGGGGVSMSNPVDMVHSSLNINKINYVDEIDSISEDYEFIGGGNNQIARLKDFSNYLAKNNTTAFTPTGDYQPATKKYVDDNAGTEYNAGTGIEIGTEHSDMQGPAPDGFHVPLNTDRQAVYNVWTALGGGSSDGTNFGIALKLPFAGFRKNSSADVNKQGTYGLYWSSSRNNANNAYNLNFNSTALNPQNNNNRAYGYPVRCFKNSPVVPTSNWTKLYGTSIESGGIFWSSTDGLISLSSDGSTWITIADKNLGATTVWNSGDTLSETNCGKYYQWGNNYGFPRTGTIANQSATQVDASNYGPGDYYSSDTFIKNIGRRDTTDNGNLWGGVSQGTWVGGNTITNTGVLSVNGQTGDVTIDISGKQDKATSGSTAPATTPSYIGQQYVDTTNDKLYVATGTSSSSDWSEVGGGGSGDMSYSDFGWQAKTGATITLDLASTYTPSANFTVNAPATIKDGQTYILRVNNGSTAYTMTLGTNVTNPFDTDITLTANGIDQFVFLAINGELELQPEGGGGGGDGFILAPNSPLTPKYFWYGTQVQYEALTQYYTDEENDTVYFTI